MTIIGVCIRVLFALAVFSLIYLSWYKMRRKSPVFDSQRMCPHCGRITARAKAACLECGKEPIP